AILVIALVVIPPATAYLLSNRLPVMITLTVVISGGGALAGFWLAYVLDAATSAGMSVFYGLIFAGAFVFSRVRIRMLHKRPGPIRRHGMESARKVFTDV